MSLRALRESDGKASVPLGSAGFTRSMDTPEDDMVVLEEEDDEDEEEEPLVLEDSSPSEVLRLNVSPRSFPVNTY